MSIIPDSSRVDDGLATLILSDRFELFFLFWPLRTEHRVVFCLLQRLFFHVTRSVCIHLWTDTKIVLPFVTCKLALLVIVPLLV